MYNFIFRYLVVFFFIRCAVIMHPTGGPKDIKNPVLVCSNPSPGDINFNKSVITLKFDKDIIVNNLSGISIKSLVSKKSIIFTTQTKDKILTIKITEPLDKDDFFVLSCLNAICDTTEGNKLEAINIGFSTGELKGDQNIAGQVFDAKTNQPSRETYILLYKVDDSQGNFNSCSIFLDKKPDLITQTGVDGKFSFNNILKGKYKVYASANAMLSSNSRQNIGIYPCLIKADDDTLNDKLQIFITELDIAKLSILKYLVTNRHIYITTDKPIEDIRLDNKSISFSLSANKCFACVYLNALNEYEVGNAITLTLIDENRNALRYDFSLEDIKHENKPLGLECYFRGAKVIPSKGELCLFASNPIKNFRVDSFDWCKFTFGDNQVINIKEVKLSHDRKKIIFSYDFQDFELQKLQSVEANFIIAPNSIIDIDGNNNDEVKVALSIKSFKEYGSVSGTVKIDSGFRLELFNVDKGIVYECNYLDCVDNQYVFRYVDPGRYLLRAFLFSENFNYWSAGNIDLDLAADRVILYPNVINVLANWDNEFIDLE